MDLLPRVWVDPLAPMRLTICGECSKCINDLQVIRLYCIALQFECVHGSQSGAGIFKAAGAWPAQMNCWAMNFVSTASSASCRVRAAHEACRNNQ